MVIFGRERRYFMKLSIIIENVPPIILYNKVYAHVNDETYCFYAYVSYVFAKIPLILYKMFVRRDPINLSIWLDKLCSKILSIISYKVYIHVYIHVEIVWLNTIDMFDSKIIVKDSFHNFIRKVYPYTLRLRLDVTLYHVFTKTLLKISFYIKFICRDSMLLHHVCTSRFHKEGLTTTQRDSFHN